MQTASTRSHPPRPMLHSDAAFVARSCKMVPIEFVTRRLAYGSFLRRNKVRQGAAARSRSERGAADQRLAAPRRVSASTWSPLATGALCRERGLPL